MLLLFTRTRHTARSRARRLNTVFIIMTSNQTTMGADRERMRVRVCGARMFAHMHTRALAGTACTHARTNAHASTMFGNVFSDVSLYTNETDYWWWWWLAGGGSRPHARPARVCVCCVCWWWRFPLNMFVIFEHMLWRAYTRMHSRTCSAAQLTGCCVVYQRKRSLSENTPRACVSGRTAFPAHMSQHR